MRAIKFEDITDSAKVGTTGWSNGVAMVDINQDGFVAVDDILILLSVFGNTCE